jgi:hypothetical protein
MNTKLSEKGVPRSLVEDQVPGFDNLALMESREER